MKLKQHRPSPTPPTVDELLRPELECYSTSVLIAELARRGTFQSVPELPGSPEDVDDCQSVSPRSPGIAEGSRR